MVVLSGSFCCQGERVLTWASGGTPGTAQARWHRCYAPRTVQSRCATEGDAPRGTSKRLQDTRKSVVKIKMADSLTDDLWGTLEIKLCMPSEQGLCAITLLPL